MEATLTIQGVEGRTTSRGLIYDVATDKGKYATFEEGVAQAARAAIGTTVQADVVTKPNKDPQYPPNQFLNGIGSVVGIAQPSQNGFVSAAPAQPNDVGQKSGRNNIAARAVPALIALSDGKPETLNRLLSGLARWSETGEPAFISDDIPF